jgi:hypothetical protein
MRAGAGVPNSGSRRMKFFRRAVLAAAASIVGFALPIAGSAQTPPEATVNAQQPAGWEVSYGLRAGYFLPQRDNSGTQSAVRRPTYGVELGLKRKDSWYGARALFERSTRWTPEQDPASGVLGRGGPLQESDGSRYFETVVVDAVAYSPVYEGVRGYVFSGYGTKIIGSPAETPILPYSFTGEDRARAWHGGFGIEAPLPGGSVVFELGDYYGPNGGDVPVHDLHITLLARVSSVRELVTSLGMSAGSSGGFGSDG